ncbi:hypothetical protein [Spirulina sp. 06S082]|uniref:hypothetical protein n=1 Tax=Spirulina sp. 06S082 TaxID=3110248 RepID=UPI002B1ED61A|nr:hypothetical protein [Spirulina sp. 06S082]
MEARPGEQGEGEQTKTYYQLCLQLCQEISRTDAMAKVLLEMAKLAEAEGDIHEAIAFANRAETIATREHLNICDRAACLRETLRQKQQLKTNRYSQCSLVYRHN